MVCLECMPESGWLEIQHPLIGGVVQGRLQPLLLYFLPLPGSSVGRGFLVFLPRAARVGLTSLRSLWLSLFNRHVCWMSLHSLEVSKLLLEDSTLALYLFGSSN